MLDNKELPKFTVICSIGYRVQECEGLISFCEDGGVWGVHSQFAFHRADNGKGCWYLEMNCTFGHIMASHIVEAYKFVIQHRGDDWGVIPTKVD